MMIQSSSDDSSGQGFQGQAGPAHAHRTERPLQEAVARPECSALGRGPAMSAQPQAATRADGDNGWPLCYDAKPLPYETDPSLPGSARAPARPRARLAIQTLCLDGPLKHCPVAPPGGPLCDPPAYTATG
jgi:hypothetical protein